MQYCTNWSWKMDSLIWPNLFKLLTRKDKMAWHWPPSRFDPHFRSLFMRIKTSRVAPMSATRTAPTCTPTSAAVTPSGWMEAAGCCMRGPTTLATSTSWPGGSTQTTSAGWATMTTFAPAVISLMWVAGRWDVVVCWIFVQVLCEFLDLLLLSFVSEGLC